MLISCTLLKDHWVFPSNPNVDDLDLIMIFIPNFVPNTPLMPTWFGRSRSGQLVLRFPFCQLRPLLLQLLSPLLEIPATAPANRTNDFWLSFFLFLTWDQILVRWSQRTMFVFSLFWQEIVDGVKRERESGSIYKFPILRLFHVFSLHQSHLDTIAAAHCAVFPFV